MHRSPHISHFAYESMGLVLLVDVESNPLRTARRGFSFLMPGIAIYL